MPTEGRFHRLENVIRLPFLGPGNTRRNTKTEGRAQMPTEGRFYRLVKVMMSGLLGPGDTRRDTRGPKRNLNTQHPVDQDSKVVLK